jgi:copper resistance protein B
MIARAAPVAAALLLAAPVVAQDHAGHAMPGMAMPAAPAPAPAAKAPSRPPPPRTAHGGAAKPAPIDHGAMDHGTMDHGSGGHDAAAIDHQGHAMTQPMPDGGQSGHAGHQIASPPEAAGHTGHAGHMPPPAAATAREGTDLAPGDAPAPAAPAGHWADRYWDPAAMARARDTMMREGGAQTFAQIMVNRAEIRVRDGRDGYRWEGEGWFGGDINRLVVKTEGEGTRGERLEAGEVQALYSRAVGPYFNLQAGVRHDVRPTPDRTFAAIGVQGLAPYWFEVEATAFLSTRGDLIARTSATYDQRLTQRLILQPRAEIELAAQDMRARGIGSGVSEAELGLRLRYEISRQFAPYVGVAWERRLGRTARFARAAGDDPGGAALTLGVRAWF